MATTISVIRAGRAQPVVLNIDERTTYTKKLMGDNVIKCEILSKSVLDVRIADYITFNSLTYTINRLPIVTKTSLTNYQYSIYFEADVYSMSKKIFMHDGLASFSYDGTLTDLMNLIVTNLNTTQPTWTVTVTADPGTYKTMQFANESCRAVMVRICEAFAFEFDVVGKAITVKNTVGESLNYEFEYGRDNGLYKIERQQISDQNIVTKAWGFGSTKNIPFGYRNGAQRLVFEERFVEVASDYGVIEGQFTDEDIYPHWDGVLTGENIVFDGGSFPAIARVDRIVRADEAGDSVIGCNGYSHTMVWNTDLITTLELFAQTYGAQYGNVTLQVMESFILAVPYYILFVANVAGVDFAAATISAHGTAENIIPNQVATSEGGTDYNPALSYVEDSKIFFDLNSESIKGEGSYKMVFTSGACSGMEFEIYRFDFSTKRIYLSKYVDADGTETPRYNGGSPIKPTTNDTYTFININMPQEYIDKAEADLKTATEAYLAANQNPQVLYEAEFDPKYVQSHGYDDINPGDQVNLVDTELIGVNPLPIRVSGIEFPLVNIYKIKAIISDFVPYTFKEQIVRTVVANTLNSIFLERKMIELIRESELKIKKLIPIKEIIYFTDVEIPILTNYQLLYAANHGENPDVKCVITVDAVTSYELQQMPQFTYINGLIDTIYFYPDQGAISGKIILQ